MYQKFFDAPSEKQDRIISAAVKEFALYGYENASTNRIVAEAGISKGILFHYFGNKQNLFEFIAEYCMLVLIEDYHAKISVSETDFFVQLKRMLTLRFSLSEFYPYVFPFHNRMKNDGGEHTKEYLKQLENYSFYEPFKRCDRSAFAYGSDYEKVVQYTEWIVEGFIDQCSTNGVKSIDKAIDDFVNSYRKMLTGLSR